MGREEILLKEYETCQSHNNSLEAQVWTSTTIFMSFNVTLLGGLMFAVLSDNIGAGIENQQWLVPLFALAFFGIIAILNLWKKWLERVRSQRAINNWRMSRIEVELNIWKSRMTPIMDGNLQIPVPPEVRQDIDEIKKFCGKTTPGTEPLICIVNVTIALWFIVFIMSLVAMLTKYGASS